MQVMRMTVYLDVLLLTNFWTDFALLKTAAALTHSPLTALRGLLGAACGAVCSLAVLLPPLPQPVTLLLRLLTAWLMCAAAFGRSERRLLLRRTGCLLGISLLFCGAVYLAETAGHPAWLLMQNGSIYADISLLKLLLAVTAAAAAVSLLSARGRALPAGRYRLHLRICGTDFSLPALADSGNLLRDAFTGKPVIVCGAGLLSDWLVRFPDPDTAAASRPGFRLLPVQTVSGTALLPAFSPDFAAIARSDRPCQETPVDVLIAVSVQETAEAVVPACCVR